MSVEDLEKIASLLQHYIEEELKNANGKRWNGRWIGCVKYITKCIFIVAEESTTNADFVISTLVSSLRKMKQSNAQLTYVLRAVEALTFRRAFYCRPFENKQNYFEKDYFSELKGKEFEFTIYGEEVKNADYFR